MISYRSEHALLRFINPNQVKFLNNVYYLKKVLRSRLEEIPDIKTIMSKLLKTRTGFDFVLEQYYLCEKSLSSPHEVWLKKIRSAMDICGV